MAHRRIPPPVRNDPRGIVVSPSIFQISVSFPAPHSNLDCALETMLDTHMAIVLVMAKAGHHGTGNLARGIKHLSDPH